MILTPAQFAFLDSLGGTELLLILAVVLIFFGGEKMPELARGLGKALREFKKAASDVEQEFKRAMDEAPPKPAHPPLKPAPPAAAPVPSESPGAQPPSRIEPPADHGIEA
jgi:sec-independent protein translocase protein TatA